MVKKITPVLFVKEIEPLLPFWIDKLGFTKTKSTASANPRLAPPPRGTGTPACALGVLFSAPSAPPLLTLR